MSAALALAALSALAPFPDGAELAQLTIQQRVVIRVPMVSVAPEATRPIRLIEKKGPKCIAGNSLAGAIVTAPGVIDLVTRGGPRLRAHLDNFCVGIDLRYSFYIPPNADGKLCAKRDSIHTRNGDQCTIKKFRLFKAVSR
jgi:hypothetical protein